MGYRELEDRIKKEYQRELDEINRNSESEAGKIRGEAESAAEAEKKRILDAGRRRAELEYRRIVGNARLEARRRVSEEKNSLSEKVISEAIEAVDGLTDSRKRQLLERLVKDASYLPGKPVVKVEKAYAKMVKGKDVKVVEEDIGGLGVLIESEDGKIKVDNRLANVVGRAKTRLKPEVNRILFG
ncbi:MAG: hypothetical protein GF416_01695 [Candidatus Altiarchaeales archaeon]|nr:hypothetical protein [Candidatus Altiarchaeales archaeon]MBD3415829.1 hypothetical protein [Candidatus Altiarchaeales archaeon]